MISYYKYWQAIGKLEESIKTVDAMQPDVPDMVMAQYEMDLMVFDYWKEKSHNFTKKFLTVMVFCVTLLYLYSIGLFNNVK
jgi:hypothetical protein